MKKVADSLKQLIQNVVEPMGYELIGAEYQSGLLRVYIDQAQGIHIEDCVRVSHQLSAVLDVEDPIREAYQLEVSSPGLDRPLFEPTHYQQFIGHQISIRLNANLPGRKKYQGKLLGIENNQVSIEVEGEIFQWPLQQISRANLVPQFD